MASTDVVVIGGGVIGASVAYYLAKAKMNVTVFERRELASEATGSNYGGLPLQTTHSPDLILESASMYRNLGEELGSDLELEQTGSYLLMDNEDQLPMLEAHAKEMLRHGIRVDILTGRELREIDPDIAADVPGGSRCSDGFIVNPMKVAYAYAGAAKKLGAQLQTFTEVKQIRVENRRVKSVISSKGEVETKFVVLAAGAWAPLLGSTLNLRIHVIPRRGEIILTEAFPIGKIRYMMDADYLLTSSNLEAVKTSTDPKIRLGISAVLTQPKHGNWLIGTSRDFPGYDKSNTVETLTIIARRAVRFVPKLKHANIIRTMAGLRPFCENGHPIISSVDAVEGLVLATGHHGEGVGLAPVTGKLVSEIITSRPTMPIEEFRYEG